MVDWKKCPARNSVRSRRRAMPNYRSFANMTVILFPTAVILFSSNSLVKHMDDGTASNIFTLFILEMDF